MQCVFTLTIIHSKFLRKINIYFRFIWTICNQKKIGKDNFKIVNTNYKYPDKKNRGNFIREFWTQFLITSPLILQKKIYLTLCQLVFPLIYPQDMVKK